MNQLAVSMKATPVREIQSKESEGAVVDAVAEAVAELEDVDAGDLPPLYESIDPEILNTVTRTGRAESDEAIVVGFVYAGWNVLIREDGTIVVGDPDRQTEPTPLF